MSVHFRNKNISNTWQWSAPSHYLNQCWNIGNWTARNKIQWNFNWNSNIFIQENAFQSIVWEMVAIFSRPQYVNSQDHPLSSLSRTIQSFKMITFPKHNQEKLLANNQSTLIDTTSSPKPLAPTHDGQCFADNNSNCISWNGGSDACLCYLASILS